MEIQEPATPGIFLGVQWSGKCVDNLFKEEGKLTYLVPSTAKTESQRLVKMFAFWKSERQHTKVLFHHVLSIYLGYQWCQLWLEPRARRDFITSPGHGASSFPILAIWLTRYDYNLIICNSYGFDMVPATNRITDCNSRIWIERYALFFREIV